MTEQIVVKLREVEVLCGQGITIDESVRQIGVSGQTHYRWRKKYGGMTTSDAKKYRALEKENARLKKLGLNRMRRHFNFPTEGFLLQAVNVF